MHGLGNDYVFVDAAQEDIADPVGLARAVSDRHTGVGSDGLILISPSDRADVRMEMYNADGSRAQMCGNGIRCVAKYAFEHGLCGSTTMLIQTDAGIREVVCFLSEGYVASVRVNMGTPSLAPASLPSSLPGERIVEHPIPLGGDAYAVTCVSMGNPHAVIFVDELDALPVHDLGPLLEHAPPFPERINGHFVRVDSPEHLTMRSWERGSGETRACGTGACATVVAGVLTGRCRRHCIVALPGGELEITWRADEQVEMTGPAVDVFSGRWDTSGASAPQSSRPTTSGAGHVPPAMGS